jgi:hypothetical protein
MKLFPEDDHDFFSKTADDEITFTVDSQGRVTEMVSTNWRPDDAFQADRVNHHQRQDF